MTTAPLLHAYVDETGDRGVSASSSRFFAMTGLVVAAEAEQAMRAAVADCRAMLTVPVNKHLHWQEHVKTYARRQYAINQFARLQGLVVNYVIFEKAAIPATSGVHGDQVIFYNYAAGLLMERLLLTARDWSGGPRTITVKFGHVRGFDHTDTLAYFGVKRAKDPSWVPWHLLQGEVKFLGMGQYDGLQAADVYSGALNVALCPDKYGGYEPHHLIAVRHQIRRYQGRSWGSGFKAMALPGSIESLPWWPREGL